MKLVLKIAKVCHRRHLKIVSVQSKGVTDLGIHDGIIGSLFVPQLHCKIPSPFVGQ